MRSEAVELDISKQSFIVTNVPKESLEIFQSSILVFNAHLGNFLVIWDYPRAFIVLLDLSLFIQKVPRAAHAPLESSQIHLDLLFASYVQREDS